MDRRGFLECMAWVGTGVVWTSAGGVLSSRTLAHAGEASSGGDFSFVQISDTHIGFTGEANKDVTRTLQEAIIAVNALPTPPAFVLHTGDLTHAQKPGAFDAVAELLKTVRTERVFYVPGANDVFLEGGNTCPTGGATAAPQPAPGTAPGPGRMKVPQGRLRRVLGLREVTYGQGRSAVAVVDRPLA